MIAVVLISRKIVDREHSEIKTPANICRFTVYENLHVENSFPESNCQYTALNFLNLHKISKIYLYINTVELPQPKSLQATRSYADGLKTNYISIRITKIYLYISPQSVYHSKIAYRQPVICRFTKDKLSNTMTKIYNNAPSFVTKAL